MKLLTVTLIIVVFSTVIQSAPSISSSSEDPTFTSSEYYEELSSPPPPPAAVRLDFTYHNYTALTDYVRNLADNYPSLTHLYSIGKSVQKRELWVLAVSSTPNRHVLGKPEIKYIGNIHGNEPISKELLLHFALHLVTHYGYDPVVTALLDRCRIHFLFSMNPDGFEKSKPGTCDGSKGRGNQKEYDLNRNFPDYFKNNSFPIQLETRAVMDWMSQIHFVMSAGLHGGTLVASYPYENHVNTGDVHLTGPKEHVSPDDDVFRHLATVYATNHATMSEGKPCPNNKREGFPNGIINGAKWYAVTGGMQDYNYIFHGTMEITLEVSCCKHPKASLIQDHWQDNRKALIAYVFEALRGVKGFVSDAEDGRPLSDVQLYIKGRNRDFNTTSDGEYWRILLDGNYTLQAFKTGYEPLEEPFQVRGDEATILNVTLRRLAVSPSTNTDGDGVVVVVGSMNVSTEPPCLPTAKTENVINDLSVTTTLETTSTILSDPEVPYQLEGDEYVESTVDTPSIGAVSSSAFRHRDCTLSFISFPLSVMCLLLITLN